MREGEAADQRCPSLSSSLASSSTSTKPLSYPQTHFIWHKIANILVDELGFTCILPDLRGYGQSSKPRASPDGNHVEYSKREMANDVIQVVCVCLSSLREKPGLAPTARGGTIGLCTEC